jgi:hypothetical protein
MTKSSISRYRSRRQRWMLYSTLIYKPTSYLLCFHFRCIFLLLHFHYYLFLVNRFITVALTKNTNSGLKAWVLLIMYLVRRFIPARKTPSSICWLKLSNCHISFLTIDHICTEACKSTCQFNYFWLEVCSIHSLT